MTPPSPIPIELLLRHTGGLRALARGLLGDADAAEDVVQETFVAALRTPPADRSRLGAWLRSVARRNALSRRRGNARREAREAFAAHRSHDADGPATTDPAVDSEEIERRQLLRTVLDTVLALDEPYQSVVLLRYVQDLSVREIAAQRGVPVATVKSQLSRALARLRTSLDESAGGRRQWAVLLATATGLETGAPAPGSWITMLTDWKVLLTSTGVVALAAIGATSSHLGLGSPPSNTPAGGSSDDPAGAPVAALLAPSNEGVSPGDDDGKPSGRIAIAGGSTADAVVPAAPYAVPANRFEVTGLVLDADDLPVDGAHLYLGPELHPLTDFGETGTDGTFTLAWRGDAARQSVVLVARKGSRYWSGLQKLDVTASDTARVVLRVEQDAELQLKLRAVERAHAQKSLPAEGVSILEEIPVGRSLPASFFQGNLARSGAPETLDGGTVLLAWPGVLPDEEIAEILEARVVRRAKEVQVLFETKRALEVERRAKHAVAELEITKAEPEHRLEGQVFLPTGEPAGVTTILLETDGLSQRFGTGLEGAFAIDVNGADAVRLRAGGGDLGLATTTLVLEDGDLRWDPVLDRGHEIEGVLLGEDGTPLEGWRVEYRSTSGEVWADETRTKEDGSFSIPNVALGSGRLLASHADVATRLPALVHSGATPGGFHQLTVPADRVERGRVQLTISATSGIDAGLADVRLWDPTSGRGTFLYPAQTSVDGAMRYESPLVPAGDYEVVVGAIESGYRSLGHVTIAANETSDLGLVELVRPGTVTVSVPDGSENGWVLTRATPSGLFVTARGEGNALMQVAAGRLTLARDGELTSAPGAPTLVRAGETKVIGQSAGGAAVVLRFGELEPGAQVSYSVAREDGTRLLAETTGAEAVRTVLAPGAYEVTATVAGDTRRASFELTAGGGSLEVTLP